MILRKFAVAVAVAVAVAIVALLLALVFLSDRGGPESPTVTESPETVEVVEPGPGVAPPVDDRKISPRPAAVAPLDRGPSVASLVGVIRGRVVAEESLAPIPDALVRIVEDIPVSSYDRVAWLDDVQSDGGGHFRFEGLRRTLHRLRVSAPGRLDQDVSGVAARGEEFELRMVAADDVPCWLMVSSDDGEEAPLRDHHVFLELTDESWSLDARSDESGVFLISGISREVLDQRFKLVGVIVDGHADPFLLPSKRDPGVPYTVVVDHGATVFGRVVEASSGRPVPDARIVSDCGHVVWADGSGKYRVSGVEDGLIADAPGYAAETKELDDFTDDLQFTRPVKIDFKLTKGIALFGTVRDSAGNPLAGIRVGVAPDELELDIDEERMEVRLRESLSSISDDRGRYRIEGLPVDALELPGFFEIEIRPPGSSRGITEDVDVDLRDGEFRHDISLDLVKAVTGTVSRGNGSPVVDSRISVESVSEDTYQVTATDVQGAFEFGQLPAGEYHLVVESDGRPVLVAQIVFPAAGPLDLRLEPGKSLSGTVVAERDGTPLEAMRVRVVYFDGNLDVSAEDRSDADGFFSFRDVPPGMRTLELARPPPLLPFHPDVARHRVTLDLESGDWEGVIEYPGYPCGEVVLHLVVGRGRAVTPGRPIEVQVAYYERGRFRVGSPTGRRRGFRVGSVDHAGEVFRGRFREGKYVFRGVLESGGKKIMQNVSAVLSDGDVVELDVVFSE